MPAAEAPRRPLADRPLALFFGASWCGMTTAIMPALRDAYQARHCRRMCARRAGLSLAFHKQGASNQQPSGAARIELVHVPSDGSKGDLDNWVKTSHASWLLMPDPSATVVADIKKHVRVATCCSLVVPPLYTADVPPPPHSMV